MILYLQSRFSLISFRAILKGMKWHKENALLVMYTTLLLIQRNDRNMKISRTMQHATTA